MKPTKTVMVGQTECRVETLMEWIDSRVAQITSSGGYLKGRRQDHESLSALYRLMELSIIRDKVNDGRIQEIGKAKFKGEKRGN